MFNITTGLTIWCSEAVTFGTLLFFAWRQDRQTPSYLVWALGFIISAFGFAFIAARGVIPNIFSIEIGNGLALLGESAWIAGFRMLDNRRISWSCLLPPAIWFASVELPWVHESFNNRVILYDLASAVGATLLAATTLPAEGRREKSRVMLSIVFMILASSCFGSAVAMVLIRPSEANAMIYRGYSTLATALQIIFAIAFSGRLLMERAEWRWRAVSITDTLTGILNRRGLQEYFEQITGRAGHSDRKIAALLFDLDHFKAINDRYGHQTGDIVLAEFARISRQFIPRSGIFGRMGGEEFTAFVPVGDQAEAEAIAELIRSEFCRMPLFAGRSLVPATVSIGIALSPSESAHWDRLVSAADRALYAAKRAGRNCAIVFSEAEAANAADAPPDPHAGDLVPTLDDQIHALRRMGTLSRL